MHMVPVGKRVSGAPSSVWRPYAQLCFFLFQAEDGIRDKLVTGVQTCALPIFADKGPLKGVGGFYYLDASASDAFDVRLYTTCPTVPLPGCVIPLPGLTAITQGDVHTKAWAVFGDFTYDFSPQWSVSLGGRFTNDERRAKVFRQNYTLGGQPQLGGSPPFGVGTPFGAPTSNFQGRR